jgi:glycosyltransferase involved in cell wall biosynthesis
MPFTRDAAAVGRALADLAGDRALRRRLGDAARRRALDYSWERSVRSVSVLYEQLMGKRRAAVGCAS